jgi:hypothetical protein
MYGDRYARRQARAYRRQMRRSYRTGLGGLAGGFFFIGLALAFALSSWFGGSGFLFFLFAGLAFASLFGSATSMNPRGLYGGLQGFVWLMGLAILFVIGFWPWILVLLGISAILGSLIGPITAGLLGLGMYAAMQSGQPQQTYQQPYQQAYSPEQPPPEESYAPYQQGYHPPQPAPGTYQEGGYQYQYPQPKQEFEQPGTNPPQELPPQQQ